MIVSGSMSMFQFTQWLIKQAIKLAALSKAIMRNTVKIEKTGGDSFSVSMCTVRRCVSTVVCSGPRRAEAPSNRRHCCTQDSQRKTCDQQQRTQGRNAPPFH